MRTRADIKKEWFYDESFWKHFAPIMFDDTRWGEVGEVADGVTRLAGLRLYDLSDGKKRQPPRLVDLCCGFGRMTLEFARRGFRASGVDITKSYLETAMDESAYEGLKIEFIEKDVRTFMRKEAFDVAVNLYNSFGYFEDPADDFIFVKNAFMSLKKGGSFIIDVLGKEIAVRDYIAAEWFERQGFLVLTESEPVDSWASIWNRWIIIKGSERHEKVFIQRLYAASELRRLFLDAGFSTVELYGAWDESPYDTDAKTLIAVGRKF